MAQKSLKAKITLHPTFNVFVRIAQNKTAKETSKKKLFTRACKEETHRDSRDLYFV